VDRKATVSSASTVKVRNNSSFPNFTTARLVAGELASGIKASTSVASCFSEVNFKRNAAFALIAIEHSQLIRQEIKTNK